MAALDRIEEVENTCDQERVEGPIPLASEAIVDRENDVSCPICSSPLPNLRAIRSHLQSSRHNVNDKDKLTIYIDMARERARAKMYEGGLAKNIVDNESKTREMEFEINNKSLNMKFGENSSMQMVVIKVRGDGGT